MATNVEYTAGPIDPLLARQFPQYGRTLLFFFALRMAAMYVISTSNIAGSAMADSRLESVYS